MAGLTPRVLVLEDDEYVSDIILEVLSRAGMYAEAAPDAVTALQKIDATEFDVIVADVLLPGELDGPDTVRRARARHPRLRSLFISGGSMPRLADPCVDDFVQKPFAFHELVGCVWELFLREDPKDWEHSVIVCIEPEAA